jgi:aconitate hydratase 2/2-methylisocitrate dehydratase
VVIDLDMVEEPMIADQMLIMQMFLRDIHTILLDRFLFTEVKKVDLGFVGSCMVHKGENSFSNA